MTTAYDNNTIQNMSDCAYNASTPNQLSPVSSIYYDYISNYGNLNDYCDVHQNLSMSYQPAFQSEHWHNCGGNDNCIVNIHELTVHSPPATTIRQSFPTSSTKKIKNKFTRSQLVHLESEFHENKYLSRTRRKQMARELNLNECQIKIWFKNKRMRYKKEQIERISSTYSAYESSPADNPNLTTTRLTTRCDDLSHMPPLKGYYALAPPNATAAPSTYEIFYEQYSVPPSVEQTNYGTTPNYYSNSYIPYGGCPSNYKDNH